jgi:hypothetical protein
MPLRSKSLSRESGSALDLLIPNLPGLEALRAITTVGSEVRTVLLCSAIQRPAGA